MKKILCLVLFSLGIASFAQTTNNKPYVCYCSLYLTLPEYLTLPDMRDLVDNERAFVVIDLPFRGKFLLGDSEGYNVVIPYYSVSSILTYMSKLGWEYVETLRETRDNWVENKTYIMRKLVSNDEEVLEGIYLKERVESKERQEQIK